MLGAPLARRDRDAGQSQSRRVASYTYRATSSICSAVNVLLNGGMAPTPFVTAALTCSGVPDGSSRSERGVLAWLPVERAGTHVLEVEIQGDIG